ncbi:MAG: hypothetical protein M1831_003133 [Alyxoria varia]|nr:MAG: hypothetical protein M1831_003133 [Alyxoria varia]
MSLFGNAANQSKPSLFGSLNTGNSQPQQAGEGPFGSSQAQNSGAGQGSGPFGQSQQQSSGLFGSTNHQQEQPQQQSGLFGSVNQQQPQPQQSSGLFGSMNQQQSQPLQQSSLLGSTNQQQQQQSFGGTTLAGSQQPSQLQGKSSTVWQPGNSIRPREKTVTEQMQTLLGKWSPESPNCLFQKYFYNSVGEEHLPFYGPGPREDEQKWEEALANKPSKDSVPVLCTGFAELGNRLRIQIKSVEILQARLHAIDDSLRTQQQMHELDISVRAMNARRKHIQLSQRCLRLATKAQLAKNRGYSLDSQEELLKKRLKELEDKAMDGALNSKSEGVWARMLTIRENVRILTEETERTGESLAENGEGGIDEEILRKTKKASQRLETSSLRASN